MKFVFYIIGTIEDLFFSLFMFSFKFSTSNVYDCYTETINNEIFFFNELPSKTKEKPMETDEITICRISSKNVLLIRLGVSLSYMMEETKI